MIGNWTSRVVEISGQRALVVDLDIPDNAPPEAKEGIARRRIVNSGGTCPCGARAVLPNRAQRRAAARTGQPVQTKAEHTDDCPALLKGWRVDLGQGG